MPQFPSPVLGSPDFPSAELGALVLDGEAYRIADCVAALDEVPLPAVRAAALQLPRRLIAEQHTAAWVWGAIDAPPARYEVCADITARARPAFDARLSVREVVLLHDDVVTLAGTAVTTPMRTAIDLARFVDRWSAAETEILRRLLRLGRCSVLDCARAINDRRNLPNKKIALERFALCGAGWAGR